MICVSIISVSMICVSMVGPSFAPVRETLPEVFLDPYGLPDCQARRRETIHTDGRRGIHHGGTEKCGLFSRPSLPRDPPWAAPIPHVETHDMRLHDMRLHDMRLHGRPILRTRLEKVSKGLPRPLRTS